MNSDSFSENSEKDNKVDTKFSQVYEKYYIEVYKYVFSIVKNPTIAKDIAQEVFIGLYSQMCKSLLFFYKLKNIKYWLFKMAKCDCIDYMRKTYVKNEIASSTDFVYNDYCKEDRFVQLIEDKEILKKALQQLDIQHKMILEYKYIKNYKSYQIASELNISTATVCRKLKEAYDLLYILLRDENNE